MQRPCKMVKYLSQLGWQVDVITAKEIVYHSKDETLLSECRAHKITRTASLDPMYLMNKLKNFLGIDTQKLYFNTRSDHKRKIKQLFPVDDKIGWVPFAIRAGKQALLTNRYNAVMVTCGPFSSALAARYIARKGKIPFILDYRDHWTLSNIAVQPKGIFFRLLQFIEKKCLDSADLVLTATECMKQDLANHFGSNIISKTMPFFNGWDEADFVNMSRQRKEDGKIRISYIGAFYGQRSLTPLFNALVQFREKYPERDFEFLFVGNFYPETHLEAEQSSIRNKITFIPQQPHAQAIQIMLDSDILILVIGGEEYKWVLSGKLFEYLRSQRHILAMVHPDSEAAKILNDCGHSAICPIDDTEAIRRCFEQLFSNDNYNQYKIPGQFERSTQVKNLHDKLNSLCNI